MEGLPISRGKGTDFRNTTTLFLSPTHISVARSFLDHIFKLHELLEIIISVHDVTFTSSFSKELFRLWHQIIIQFSLSP